MLIDIRSLTVPALHNDLPRRSPPPPSHAVTSHPNEQDADARGGRERERDVIGVKLNQEKVGEESKPEWNSEGPFARFLPAQTSDRPGEKKRVYKNISVAKRALS